MYRIEITARIHRLPPRHRKNLSAGRACISRREKKGRAHLAMLTCPSHARSMVFYTGPTTIHVPIHRQSRRLFSPSFRGPFPARFARFDASAAESHDSLGFTTRASPLWSRSASALIGIDSGSARAS